MMPSTKRRTPSDRARRHGDRLRRGSLRAAGILGAATCGAALAPLAAPTADAAPATGQQNYTCVITVDENPGQPGNIDLTASLQLELPDHVAPGDSFSLNGTFSVQIPGEMGTLFASYFPAAQVVSDGLTIPVNVGGQDLVVPTSRLDSGKQDTTKQPFVIGGQVNTEPITVPADASGEVSVSMPRNDSVDAISRDGRAAFTATLVAEGGIVPGYEKGTDRVSCDAQGDPARVGAFPIDAPAAGPAAPAAPAAGASASGGSSGTAAGGAAAAAAGAARPSAGGNAPASSSAAAKPSAGAALQKAQGDAGAVPASGASDTGMGQDSQLLAANGGAEGDGSGLYIPLEGLAWGTGLIVVSSLAFTLWSNVRLRRLTELAEDAKTTRGR